MRGSDFIFDCVNLLVSKSHKTNFKQGRSHIDSPDWIKIKGKTMNCINKKYNKCRQYDAVIAR